MRSAKQAVKEGKIALLNQPALLADAIELEYVLEVELKTVLSDLINKTTPPADLRIDHMKRILRGWNFSLLKWKAVVLNAEYTINLL